DLSLLAEILAALPAVGPLSAAAASRADADVLVHAGRAADLPAAGSARVPRGIGKELLAVPVESVIVRVVGRLIVIGDLGDGEEENRVVVDGPGLRRLA